MGSLTVSLRFSALVSYLCWISITGAEVLSTFIFTHHGERTPLATYQYPSLTPIGANQLYQAGSVMRYRYVQPTGLVANDYVIRDISQVFLYNEQVNIITTDDQWNVASAQAFMQALYPPLADYGSNETVIEGISNYANGTNVIAPMNGYQYPDIVTASTSDYETIFIQGSENCPAWSNAKLEYWDSSEYASLLSQSQSFYDSLWDPLLRGVFDTNGLGFYDADYIWDYLSYGYMHNTTVADKLSVGDYEAARLWAGDLLLSLYANNTQDGTDASNSVRTIAGQGLAYYIMASFLTSIETGGVTNKINLMFGDYTPMISFAALAGLMAPQTGAFYYLPEPGSSFILELFTMSGNSSVDYPSTTDMFVRFLYRNASDASSSIVQYPLFGLSPSEDTLSWSDFVGLMSGIMIDGVDDWCSVCGSASLFCSSTYDNTVSNPSTENHHGLKPAVAGVIGAIVALAVVAIVLALAAVLGGFRLQRRSKRTSELGGFKGSEKLASDRDLTIPKGGAGVTVSEGPRGHERVGSWELKEPVNVSNVPSGIDTRAFGRGAHDLDHDEMVMDPYGIPVKPHDTV